MDTNSLMILLGGISSTLIGIIFYDLRGQIKENTKVQDKLFTKLEVLIVRFDGVEKSQLQRIEAQERELKLLSLRIHDLNDNVAAIWGFARLKGWEIPETPNTRRRKQGEENS